MTRARHIATVAAVAVLVVGALALVAGRDDRHRLHLQFPSATNFVSGLQVRAAGVPVGEVQHIEPRPGGGVTVTVEIEDDAVWPLPVGTVAEQRYGGTISYVSRYIELRPGRPGRGTIPENGTIPGRDTRVPAEVDQVLETFDATTRRRLGVLTRRSADVVDGRQRDVQRTLRRVPGALQETRSLMHELGGDPDALSSLVASSARVTHAIRSARPGIGELVVGAAETFEALAGDATALQATLDQLPPTLSTTQRVLDRAVGSLRAVDRLSRDLKPAARAVRGALPTAERTLGRVTDVGPDLRATLATARRSSPRLRQLFQEGTSAFSALDAVSRQAIPQLECIRPYTPEIAGFAGTWASFPQYADTRDHYARIHVRAQTFPPGLPGIDAKQALTLEPQLDYAFPRPPGYNAGKPWLLPECSVGPDALDPAKDPESGKATPGGLQRSRPRGGR